MYRTKLLTILLICYPTASFAQLSTIKPVTPNASPEAQALLQYFQQISGQHTLSGQHNFPLAGDRNSQFASDFIGKTPVIWSQDFGFAAPDDKDSYKARPHIIKEAIRQHQLGSIITICWHAVPPTAKEPITFQPLPGYDTNALASVQGRLQDAQFKDILSPGTNLNKAWTEQVDTIAIYLKQLQDAHVPVLWRPYHEMNGNWFWWGGRWEGKYTTAALYRQIFDRLVNYHHLNNLVWIWSVDRPSVPGREFDKYYPGNEYLDILAIDIYGNDFNQKYYDGLMTLSNGKPLVLGEVGNPPANEILEKQPNWAYWVIWSGMVRGTSRNDFEKIAENPKVLFKEDRTFVLSIADYRSACNLSPLSHLKTDDFSGEWALNEYESKLDGSGFGAPAYKLSIIQSGNLLKLKSMTQQEWTDDESSEQSLTLDGKDNNSMVFNSSPRVQKLNYSINRDSLIIDSKTTFNFGGRSNEMTGKDILVLKRKGQKLVITQTVNSPRGMRTSTLVYDKK